MHVIPEHFSILSNFSNTNVGLMAHCTQTLSQVWACVGFVPCESVPEHFAYEHFHTWGHVYNVCTDAIHSLALWT